MPPCLAYRSAATASSIAAVLLSYYTITQVDGLLADKLEEAGSVLQMAVRRTTEWPTRAGRGPIGAARQGDSLLESQMQLGSLQYPHNLMKKASEHFHFLSVLADLRRIIAGRPRKLPV